MFYAAVIPMSRTGEVLIGKRIEDGLYTCPAGGSEGNETPEDTAIREAYEEAGLELRKEDLMSLGAQDTSDGLTCHCFMVIIDQPETTTKNDPDDEVSAWIWVKPENFPEDIKKDERRLKTINQAVMTFKGLIKGGPGSGKKGHTTAKVVSLNDKLKQQARPEEPKTRSKLEDHHDKLTSGAVVEGAQTKSEKPIFTNMEHAKAHGYDTQDHRDAMNFHYDMKQKYANSIAKLKEVGHKIPPHAEKIMKFHDKQFRAHFKEAQKLEDRAQQNAAAATPAGKIKKDMKKSVVAMGHHESGDIDTSKFITYDELLAYGNDYLPRLEELMEGFEYGDAPRTLMLDEGELHLVKVDDGMYTGFVVKTEMVENEETGELQEMAETAKVRIERMTLVDVIKFLMAKDYIKREKVDPVPEEEPQLETFEVSEGELKEEIMDSLMDKLEDVNDEPIIESPAPIDKKIKMLELMTKLLEV